MVDTPKNQDKQPSKPAPEKTSSPVKSARESKRKKPWKLLLLVILILIILGGYYYFHQHQVKLVRVNQGLAGQVANNQQQINQLQAQQQQLLQQQNKLLQQFSQHGLSDDLLTINNSVYLLQQASFKLSIEEDWQATLLLLQAAQQSVSQVKSIQFSNLAKVIATDIEAIQKHHHLDYQQLTQQFSTVDGQLERLKILTPGSAIMAKPEEMPVTGWKQHLEQSLQSLKKVIVIEHTDKQYRPLLDQQQISSFKLYLSSLYAQALWAALNHHNALYQQALNEAKKSIDEYLLNSNREKSSLLAQTIVLQKINVSKYQYQPLKSLAEAKSVQRGLQQATLDKGQVKAKEQE